MCHLMRRGKFHILRAFISFKNDSAKSGCNLHWWFYLEYKQVEFTHFLSIHDSSLK